MLATETKPLFEGNNSTVYFQERSAYDTPVVIKVARDDHASPAQIAAFDNEYAITRDLELKSIRRVYDKIEFEGRKALVMEYIPGKTIKEYFRGRTPSLTEFLPLAIKICDALGEIHQAKIIHKDVDSKNILITEEGSIKIIDFGLSTRLSVKSHNLGNPEKLEGTLSYISPEQTGRMNRMVDHRSDLYSLGVVFYEILSGQLPFQSDDAMELVHAHLALSPQAPELINADIPLLISEIIMKLLRKNAEDRYQSSYGLKSDLERCLSSLERKGKIDPFDLAKNDFSGKLQIPQKLYGRQKEIEYLLDAFERSSQGATELLLVAGYSGVGKSALVHEIHRPITQRRGYFIEGKFDQLQRNIPYFAFIQAFKSFSHNLLTENTQELERWRVRIQRAVGNNGRVLTDVMPSLELIIGPQPEVTHLGASEAQNRFNLVFQNFIRAIASPEHPLVIFVDDWQWADAASMNLLRILLTGGYDQYLFIIGAYRVNEVEDGHPFMMMVEELRKEKVSLNILELNNLSLDNLNELVSDALSMPPAEVRDLTELMYHKTQGNAFFVNQMLRSLYEETLLRFDFGTRSWTWDLEQIKALNISDNVVDLMASKVQKLPQATQNMLKLAACIGNRFNLETLAIVNENNRSEYLPLIKETLEPALMEGLIIPLEEDFKYAHDRIQQAVSSLIPEEQKKEIHLKIGQLLVKNIPEEKWDENIFDITNQWNAAIDLVSEKDLHFLIQLNLKAGKKARDSAAYRPAYSYLKLAIDLLPDNSWEENYLITLEIYSEILEAAFLKGDLSLTFDYIQVFKEKARTTLDKIPAYEIEMQYHIAEGNQQKALEVGLDVVKLLNITLSDKAFEIPDIDALIDLPELENTEVQAAMEIMDSIITPAWVSDPYLFEKICYTMVNLSVQYGNSASACVGYAFYGGLLCGKLLDIEKGYQFGKLGVNLLEKYDAKFFKSKVENLYVSTVMPWKDPARATLKPHAEAAQIGLETGEIEFASYNIVESCLYQFLMGIELNNLHQKYSQNLNLIRQLKQYFHVLYLTPWQQMVENLTSNVEDVLVLKGHSFDEGLHLPQFLKEKQLTLSFVTYQAKTLLAFLFKNYDKAYEWVQEADKYKDGLTGTLLIPVHNYLHSLILIARFPEVSVEEKQAFLKKIDANQKDLKLWSFHAPENYEHKYKLIQAETMRLSGQHSKAMDLYDEAIQGASDQNFTWEEALFNELAGDFYLSLNKVKIARTYLNDAYYNYQLWGAHRKLEFMKNYYGKHLMKKHRRSSSNNFKTSTQYGNNSSFGSNLDMTTIIKASQALSSEVVLANLLKKMMRIVIENAGAEKGIFILKRNDQWVIEAECYVQEEEIEAMCSIPIESVNGLTDEPRLSSEVVYYVIRTGENLVISDASKDDRIVGPNYVQKANPKSILCMPLIYQNKITGILYLENNLATDAFTPDRLEILEILSTQINISIENALLYENLEEKVKERTAEVVSAKEIIEKKNADITSSINYAKRIQQATLPQYLEIKALLPDSFIMFRPRDIVSGDFYWFSRMEPRPIYEETVENGLIKKVQKGYESEKLVITAIDCTGHGVPGAFMSMIANDLLNGIVDIRGISNPAIILHELHHGVTNSLRQQETDNKDGMDMALCVIDAAKGKVEFSGAKNPLIYIQNNELYHIKGDKYPIGGLKHGERNYNKHTISLNAPTTFYMFSDGYPDQFGGDEGRKFMIKRFKKLLLEIHREPLERQQEILEESFARWIGNRKQLDDVLVMGFRL